MVSDLTLQGKIILAGSLAGSQPNDKVGFGIVRVLSNGNLDSSFGINGVVKTDFADSLVQAESIAIQPDGKILVAGGFCPLVANISKRFERTGVRKKSEALPPNPASGWEALPWHQAEAEAAGTTEALDHGEPATG